MISLSLLLIIPALLFLGLLLVGGIIYAAIHGRGLLAVLLLAGGTVMGLMVVGGLTLVRSRTVAVHHAHLEAQMAQEQVLMQEQWSEANYASRPYTIPMPPTPPAAPAPFPHGAASPPQPVFHADSTPLPSMETEVREDETPAATHDGQPERPSPDPQAVNAETETAQPHFSDSTPTEEAPANTETETETNIGSETESGVEANPETNTEAGTEAPSPISGEVGEAASETAAEIAASSESTSESLVAEPVAEPVAQPSTEPSTETTSAEAAEIAEVKEGEMASLQTQTPTSAVTEIVTEPAPVAGAESVPAPVAEPSTAPPTETHSPALPESTTLASPAPSAMPSWVEHPPREVNGQLADVLISEPSELRSECERDIERKVRASVEHYAMDLAATNGKFLPASSEIPRDLLKSVRREQFTRIHDSSVGDMQVVYQLIVFDESAQRQVEDWVRQIGVTESLRQTAALSTLALGFVTSIFGVFRLAARRSPDPLHVG